MRDPAVDGDLYGFWMRDDHRLDDERAWRRCMSCRADGWKILLCHAVKVPLDVVVRFHTHQHVKVVTCHRAYCQAKLEDLAAAEALRTMPFRGSPVPLIYGAVRVRSPETH